MGNIWRSVFAIVTAAGMLVGCNMPATRPGLDRIQVEVPASTTTLTPFLLLHSPEPTGLVTPTATDAEIPPTPSPEPSSNQPDIWVDANLPDELRAKIAIPAGFSPAASAEDALLRLEVGDGGAFSLWVYALVAPFPTTVQDVSSESVRQTWTGQLDGPFAGRPLLVDQSTATVFSALWGLASAETVKVLPADELLDYAWEERPSWALVPFENLEPRWKVLEVDGQSPIRKEFDPVGYALSIPVTLKGEEKLVELVRALYGPALATPLVPPSNRIPEKLTTLALTGVTALVRATAYTMERQGITYPGRDVRDYLRAADITHISNEVPFARDCPPPNPVQQDLRFCSDARYIKLLDDVGTDIVELSGDHFQDWGREAMEYTLELYRERGWHYYGGGENVQEGRQALLLEHNGNKLALIGCNGKGGGFAHAGPNRPGAVVCDFDWMREEIPRLRDLGYLPVVTFQHLEYYTYRAQALQKRDFREAARAGAVIVSGSQAHQPQAFEFTNGALIHYGLGNLFFDQYGVSEATRQAFIDLHVFYDGRHISSELLPIIFEDYARPRPMDRAESEELLQTVFNASGW